MYIEVRWIRLSLGILTLLGGVSVLLGWHFDILFLKNFSDDLTPMNPISALFLSFAGLWFVIHFFDKLTFLLSLISTSIFIFGLVHFFTFFFPIEGIRLDYLLFGEKVRSNAVSCLVAPNTSFIFMIHGYCLFTYKSFNRAELFCRQILIFVALFLTSLTLLGYLYHIPANFHISKLRLMSPVSGAYFYILSFAVLLSNHYYGISRLFVLKLEGSVLLRRISIFILVIPFIGYFLLEFMVHNLVPMEVGVEFYSLIVMGLFFLFFVFYASLQNKKIVKQIELEKRLAASEHMFRSLVNSLLEGVASLDSKGNLTYCNASFCSILGFEEHELIGVNIGDLVVPPNMRILYQGKLEEPERDLEEMDVMEIYKKSGEKVFVVFKSKSLISDNGQSNGHVITFTDITEERRKMEDLKAFSSSAAHDLNSPLTKIATLIELIETDNLDNSQKNFLGHINTTVTNMKQLLHDLLSFSRLGSSPLPKSEVDLNSMVKEICSALAPINFHGNINIQDLPVINGNEGAIRQLYTNLISNAFKYSSQVEHPQIEIGWKHLGADKFLYVKDNGVGLNEEQVKQLFTPFKRFHAKFEGNGLGLAIVKRIIEKHGGSVRIESKENEGLCFCFTLEHA